MNTDPLKKLYLIGAFDRYNFGDIMMPVIFTKYFKSLQDCYQIFYISQRATNMQYCGGFDTCTMKTIVSDSTKIGIIIGGHILGTDYIKMYVDGLDNSKRAEQIIHFSKNKKLTYFVNKYCKWKLHSSEVSPWIIDTTYFNKVIYNTVGGEIKHKKNIYSLKDLKIIKNNIRAATYISTRDDKSFENVKLITNNVKKYPDSVSLISSLYPQSELIKLVDSNLISIITKNDYFVFQVNEKIGKDIIQITSEKLQELCDLFGLKCFLLILGYAEGHNDSKVLSKINSINPKNMIYLSHNTIYDITYIISNAKFYIGSSLHGAITAMSYSVPHTAYTSKSTKLISYLSTWQSTRYMYAEPNELISICDNLLHDNINQEKTNKAAIRVSDLAKENFENIRRFLF